MNLARHFLPRAALVLAGSLPAAAIASASQPAPIEAPYLLTPKPAATPRINAPAVYGARPGHPFLYRIPTQGERPLRFSARGLPAGLRLDPATGIITGTTPGRGEYVVTLLAANRHGEDRHVFKIVSGDRLALTPYMGWNHWYAHFNRITDAIVREAADAMVDSGMADVGYDYVGIDDCWANAEAPRVADPLRTGPLRDEQGRLLPNKHFPDMKGLTDYIHAKGLKAGIYSSPGPKTCDLFAGSYQHEADDAQRFAAWGFDLLKYDWCYYRKVVGPTPSLAEMKRPYQLMGDCLRRQPRDIIFNLCQYGMGDVWEWGADVGGQSWRTATDLGLELDRFFTVALRNCEHRAWQKPGAWNDPDYIQIGWIGKVPGGGLPEPSRLTPSEQYAFMSLWALMSSPLIFGGDLTKLDEFTLNVLCNPEIIAVNQDPLGQCARVIRLDETTFLMVKDLADGTKAVGLGNRGEAPARITAKWRDLGLAGPQAVRDVWREKDLGAFLAEFAVDVPRHGVAVIKLTPAASSP